MFTRLRDAADFTRRGDNPLRDLFVGGVLLTFSLSILPAAVLTGYQLDVLSTAARGGQRLPTIDSYRRAAARGGRALIVSLVYAGSPLVLLGYLAATMIQPSPGLLPSVSLDLPRILLGLAAALVPFLLVPPALISYIDTDRLMAAFDLRAVLRPLASPRYLLAAAQTFVLTIGMFTFIIIGSVLTYGSLILVSPFLIVYTFTVANYLLGTAYGEAVNDIDPRDRGELGFETGNIEL